MGRSKEAVASLMQHQSCAIRPFLLRTFLAAADDTDRHAIFIKQAMDRAAQVRGQRVHACIAASDVVLSHDQSWLSGHGLTRHPIS